jgi:hypothetical protein
MAIAIVWSSATAIAAPTPGEKCAAAKDKVAGSYYACRQKADAVAASKSATPDYSTCIAKFGDKWGTADTAGGGMCPDHIATSADMDTYLSAQATAAAAIIAGTGSIPACGDGSIDVAGEKCDGADLGGLSCASFGLHGTLACTGGCDFNLTGCTACPSPGVPYGDACWFLGANGASCTSTCGARGLVYDDATTIIAGSDGSDANCIALLDATGAPSSGLDASGDCAGGGYGCAVLTAPGDVIFRARCQTPPTDASSTNADTGRICACR